MADSMPSWVVIDARYLYLGGPNMREYFASSRLRVEWGDVATLEEPACGTAVSWSAAPIELTGITKSSHHSEESALQ